MYVIWRSFAHLYHGIKSTYFTQIYLYMLRSISNCHKNKLNTAMIEKVKSQVSLCSPN